MLGEDVCDAGIAWKGAQCDRDQDNRGYES